MESIYRAVVFCLMAMLVSSASGLQCYSCEGRDNDLCVTNPARVANTVDCRAGQCSIIRTERSDSSGTRVTIVRDCRSGSVATSSSSGNGGSSSFAHSCSTDLCNSGDGRVFNSFPGFNVNFGGASGFGNSGPAAAPGSATSWSAFLGLLASMFGFRFQ